MQQGQKEEKRPVKATAYPRYALMNSSKLFLCFNNLPYSLLPRVVLNDS